MELDLDETMDGLMSGTFRWKKTKKLPSMPAREGSQGSHLDVSKGWMEYFLSRGGSDQEKMKLITTAQSDMSIIDCLSMPLSIASLCIKAGIYDVNNPPTIMHIVCVGTSSKAEGRVLNQTNCFSELAYIFSNVKDIRLYFVGPEMTSSSKHPRNVAPNLQVSEFRGTSKEFFRQASHLMMGSSTVVVGMNCGFGNWENPLPVRFNLLMDWLPDLYFLTGTKLPLLFTCANDYADLSGEVAIMQHIMGSYFIVAPAKNDFSYASTLVPPASEKKKNKTDFSCGNSFCYGVQGHDKSRRQKIEVGDLASLMRALQAPLLPIPSIFKPALPFGTTQPESSLSHSAVVSGISPSTSTVTIEHEEFAALLRQKEEAERMQADRAAALEASSAAEKKAAVKLKEAQDEAKRFEEKQKEARANIEAGAQLEAKQEKVAMEEAVAKRQVEKRAAQEEEQKKETVREKEEESRKHMVSKKSSTTEESVGSALSKELVHDLCTVQQSTGPSPTNTTTEGTLQILVKFHVAVTSLVDLEVDIQNATKTLRLGIRINGEVEVVSVPLLSRILIDNMKAKFSKKKSTLTIKAAMVLM